MSPERTGLVVGKFMPPHTGHLYLIEAARRQVDRLSVVIFTKTCEPIPGALRAAWLRELVSDLPVLHAEQEHSVDFDDPAAWGFWVAAIREVLPAGPAILFSSETYGAELARRLGARHVLVDPARRQVPVSATQIRENPFAFWDYIPPPVRPYFARRVAVVGAESTGKTTLARALAAHFHTVWVPEFARDYLLARGGGVTLDDMPVIARGQAALEDRLARDANRLLICDTNLLTTKIWHEHYFGDCPPDIQRMAAERTAEFYLLCDVDVPWVDDGLRDSPGRREWFHERFRRELAARGLPYRVLSGSVDQRLAAAIQHVASVVGEKRA
jgi:NadR type nicotinamide-nucleotide adenylyltransferase